MQTLFFFNNIWVEGAKEDCGVILVTHMKTVCSSHTLRCVFFGALGIKHPSTPRSFSVSPKEL